MVNTTYNNLGSKKSKIRVIKVVLLIVIFPVRAVGNSQQYYVTRISSKHDY